MTLSNTTVAFNTVTGGDYIESGAGILEDGGWPAAPATLVTVGATIAYNKGPTVAGWGGGLDVVIMYLISGG
jgi:hypothetical protein